jgi:hypothetical protein
LTVGGRQAKLKSVLSIKEFVMKKDRRDDRFPLFNPKLALEDLQAGSMQYFWKLLGWATGSLMVGWAVYMAYCWLFTHLEPTAATDLVSEVACLLAAGTFVIWAIPPIIKVLGRASWADLESKTGTAWCMAVACLSTATGCLWAARQHSMNGYHLLSGILVFFAMTMIFLFKKGDRYLNLIQLALILGPQAALIVALLGP